MRNNTPAPNPSELLTLPAGKATFLWLFEHFLASTLCAQLWPDYSPCFALLGQRQAGAILAGQELDARLGQIIQQHKPRAVFRSAQLNPGLSHLHPAVETQLRRYLPR
jgi:hypothetical protein